MADCRADDTAGQARRAAAFGECTRGAKRYFFTCCGPVAIAQGPAAEEHGRHPVLPS
jgi:hypothetical protein